MKKDIFTISISDKCYMSKPDKTDYAQMKFHQEELTLKEFEEKILQGYSFCHIYLNNKRSNSNFKYTYFVCIDIDDSPINLSKYLNGIDYQPTIAYTTYSNGVNNLYAYRLLYFFNDRIIGKIYPILYDSICSLIKLDKNKDNCGKVLAQLMNGCTRPDVVSTRSDIVYSISNFLSSNLPNISEEYKNNPSTHICSKGTIGKESLLNDNTLAIETLNQDINKFLSTYAFIETLSESNLYYHNGYCLLDESYISLPVRIEWKDKKAKINKYKDGEGRRRKLFIDGLLMKKIKPNITFVELLYNLARRRQYYYDNSDGVLTNRILSNIVDSILKTNEDDLSHIINTKHPRFKTDKVWCADNNISRRSYSRKVSKLLNF